MIAIGIGLAALTSLVGVSAEMSAYQRITANVVAPITFALEIGVPVALAPWLTHSGRGASELAATVAGLMLVVAGVALLASGPAVSRHRGGGRARRVRAVFPRRVRSRGRALTPHDVFPVLSGSAPVRDAAAGPHPDSCDEGAGRRAYARGDAQHRPRCRGAWSGRRPPAAPCSGARRRPYSSRRRGGSCAVVASRCAGGSMRIGPRSGER